MMQISLSLKENNFCKKIMFNYEILEIDNRGGGGVWKKFKN